MHNCSWLLIHSSCNLFLVRSDCMSSSNVPLPSRFSRRASKDYTPTLPHGSLLLHRQASNITSTFDAILSVYGPVSYESQMIEYRLYQHLSLSAMAKEKRRFASSGSLRVEKNHHTVLVSDAHIVRTSQWCSTCDDSILILYKNHTHKYPMTITLTQILRI